MARFSLGLRDQFRGECIRSGIRFEDGIQVLAAAVGGGGETLELTDHRDEGGGSEKDRLLALACQGQLDKDSETRLVALLADGRKPKRGDGPLALTAAEEEHVRAQGHNPRLVARMAEVHNLADYQRLKAEVEGGDDAA